MGRRFSGKVVVITGGTSGIGLACARAFVEDGASVMLVSPAASAAQAALEALVWGPGCAAYCEADVRSARAMERALAATEKRFGGVDILFNNAGVAAPGRIDELTEAEWDTCLDVNLKGAFLASRAALPRLRQRGGGVIINNASNAGLQARASDPAYCAAKAGLIMLTRSMALAHAAERIRVNAVCPGSVAGTRLMGDYLQQHADPAGTLAELMAATPAAAGLGRLIAPEEVAAAVLYLCTDEAQFITGAVLAVDGGKSAGAGP